MTSDPLQTAIDNDPLVQAQRKLRQRVEQRLAEATGAADERRRHLQIIAQRGVEALLQLAGEDVEREGIRRTPERVVDAFLEMTAGVGVDVEDLLSATFERDGYDQMVVQRGIRFSSLCEHHLIPFVGIADVGYIPGERIVGISKLARVVDAFATRLQVQERMTAQIADALVENLAPAGVGVVIRAEHSCVGCRGVKKPGSEMVTSALRGAMLSQPETRAEFLRLVGI